MGRSSKKIDTKIQKKLVGNFFVISMLEMLAEGLTLGEACGVGQAKVMELVEKLLPLSSLSVYGHRQADSRFTNEMGFALSLAMKDVRHVRSLAETSGCAVPTADAAFRHMVTAKKLSASSAREWDCTGIVSALRVQAGLPVLLKERRDDDAKDV